ncbi:epoxide hydrolase 4 [Anabrus simplex]|uniref:epoxide hydrolase 4 n=1 Tax=Anabrus simplex TaxID=316456 RepID=UPI0034DD4F4A
MGSDCYEECIVSISFWDSFKIHFFSFLVGSWVILKRCLRMLWNSKDFSVESRDTPPACLIDSSFGQHSYMKLKGVKLHYVESGSRHQPLLLLLHGFPDCWLGWRHQIQAFSKHFRIVALDLKGFGDSDKPAWRTSYRTDVILSELHSFIEALGVTRCTLIGHDLGALLGWYLIHRYPELVEKFVSISCPHPNIYWTELPRASTFNSSWVNFIQLPYLPETEALQGDLSIINQCFQHLQKKKEDAPYVDAYKYSFSRKEDWTGPINYYRNLPFYRVSEESGMVQVPCLLVTGNKDHFINLESMVKSTDYTDRFTVKIIDGAGHFPHQEMPEAVNKLLMNFLVVPESPPKVIKPQSGSGLMNRMFGAVSSTVKYGNQVVLDVVQRKTSDVVNGSAAKHLHS